MTLATKWEQRKQLKILERVRKGRMRDAVQNRGDDLLGDGVGVSDEPNYDAIFGELRWTGDIGTSASIIFYHTSHILDTLSLATSIQHLPAEILAEVFHCYILMIRRARDAVQFFPPTPYCWLIIRHVCRAWRKVALTHPVLSSYISLTRPDCVQHMLDHSGTRPLHINRVHNPFSDSGLECMRLVLDQLERVVYADIMVCDPVSDPIPQHSDLPCVSILQELTLHFPPRGDSHPPPFSCFIFPHLRVFHCFGGRLESFRAFLSSGLRCLSLSQCNPRILLDDLKVLLRGMQRLEELSLRDSFQADEFRRQVPLHAPAVELPYLKKLSIRDSSYLQGYLLLRHLVYPASASVDLSFTGDWGFPSQVLPAPVFFSKFRFPDATMPQSLLVSVHGPLAGASIHIQMWMELLTVDELRSESKTDVPPCFRLTIINVPIAVLETLMRHLPLSNVRHAHLSEPQPMHRIPWCDSMFASMSSVEMLGLEYDDWGTSDVKLTTHIAAQYSALRFPSLKVVGLYYPPGPTQYEGGGGYDNRVSDLKRLAFLLQTQVAPGTRPLFGCRPPIEVRRNRPHVMEYESSCISDEAARVEVQDDSKVVSDLVEQDSKVLCTTAITSWLAERGVSLRRSLRRGST